MGLVFEWRLDSWEGASLRRCMNRAFTSEAQSIQSPEDGSNFACSRSSKKVIVSKGGVIIAEVRKVSEEKQLLK